MFFIFAFAYITDKLQECNTHQLCENMPVNFNAELHFTMHSHFDPFWMLPFEQLQKGTEQHKAMCADCILNGILESLLEFPTATYTIADVCFFKGWYDSHPNQTVIRNLVQNGRLDIVNGGWVQNDQAVTNYQDIILQLSIGHQWLKNAFNMTPTVAFNIDSYGHSSAQTGINALFGMTAQIIERVDINDVMSRVKNKALEFIWHSGPNDYQVLTHLRFRRHGAYAHHTSALAQLKSSGDGFCVQVFNQLKEFEQQLLYQKQGSASDLLFHYGGDTFQHLNSSNYEAQNLIVEFYNVFKCRTLRVVWSSPKKYFSHLSEKIEPRTIPHKFGDFLPYQEEGFFFTALYTTFPNFKFAIRQASLELDVLQLYAVQHNLNLPLQQLREVIALAQHHEGMTGTSKYTILEEIQRKAYAALENIKLKLNQPQPIHLDLIGQSRSAKPLHKHILFDCNSDRRCVQNYFLKHRRGDTVIILIYNHQHAQQKVFELAIPITKVQILTKKGYHLEQQEVRCWNDECTLYFSAFMGGYSEEQFILNFQCEQNQCAPLNQFKLFLDLTDQIKQLEKDFEEGMPIAPFSWNETVYDIPIQVTREGIDHEFKFEHNGGIFSLQYQFYPNQKLQTQYSASKHTLSSSAGKYIMLNEYENGGLICEFDKMFILEQATPFKEIIMFCGKIYQVSLLFFQQGVEIRTNMNSTGFQLGDYTLQFTFHSMKNHTHFFTDTNGWHMMYRQNGKREDYDPQISDQDIISGNVYPMTAYALLQSEGQVAAVITDRAQGYVLLQAQRFFNTRICDGNRAGTFSGRRRRRIE